MDKISAQKAIVEKHLANDFPLLKKWGGPMVGNMGHETVFFTSAYYLSGLANHEKKFLPRFGFNVASIYVVQVPREAVAGDCSFSEKGIGVELNARSDDGLVEVTFPHIPDLFYLRNLSNEGMILSIPVIHEEETRARLPIDKSQIHAEFRFQASSTTFKQIFATMDIDHPDAESLIQQYLEAIDRRFDDYRGLEQHFKEKDENGNTLWEDQNMQSKKYNSTRKKLHKALFSELEAVLKKVNVKLG